MSKRIIRNIVVGVTVTFIVMLLVLAYGAHHPFGRALTHDEQSIGERVYGSDIDWARVRIVRGSMWSTWSAMTLGYTIHMKNDFALNIFQGDVTADTFLFIHELAHIWQYERAGWQYLRESMHAQVIALVTTGSRLSAYDWRKAANNNIPFSDWNVESRAEAIAAFGTYRILTNTPRDDADITKLGCTIPLFVPRYCGTQ